MTRLIILSWEKKLHRISWPKKLFSILLKNTLHRYSKCVKMYVLIHTCKEIPSIKIFYIMKNSIDENTKREERMIQNFTLLK